MAEFSVEELEKLESDMGEAHRSKGIIPTADFADPEEIYARMIARVRRYHPNTDISMIEKAYQTAKSAHGQQLRKSGEPYIIHPLCVGLILADLELDKETIVAGLLHDVVEDTEATTEDVDREFNKEVALLVEGVTKLGQLAYDADKVEVQAENLRKMFLAMAKDIRVILIKLADRLHNMRTLRFMTPEKQKEKARETMEIYAPLAQRLGISKVKVELEDLSLRYLEPEAYYDLVEKISLRKNEREAYIDDLVKVVKRHIEGADLIADIEGRAKHFFSIYRKMVNQNKTLDQIYDLFAIRIIVDSVKDCYAALGVIHEMYTPVPGRFKDYIAMPKPNMYQSLHTTLIGPSGVPFEIQIRTYAMHRTSEYGIAAHWKYKEGGEGSTVNKEEEKISWLRQILEWQQDATDNQEFMNLLKDDLSLFSDTVFCFTPSGDVKNLPNGSTPIDFAYAIHSAVGNRMVGAKVNGKLVPIDYVIQNGDQIDILTSQNSRGPSRDWLNVVHSTQAKNKINQWFRNESKDENIIKGKELLASYAKSKAIDITLINRPEYQAKIMRKYGFKNWEDCLAAIGQGGLKEGMIVSRMWDEYHKDHPIIVTDDDILAEHNGQDSTEKERAAEKLVSSKNGITVRGLTDVSVRFSKCCSPVPGDEIVGYVTRGRGVSVHRTDCINMMGLPNAEKVRLIEAEWQDEALQQVKGGLYRACLRIFANNRTGLLVDITRVFTERNIDINSINTSTSKQGIATMTIKFGAGSTAELNALISQIRQVESVMDVERTTG